MNNEKNLFVFYNIKKNSSWEYKKFPKGWWWVGSGSTTPINKKKIEYLREEQFNGPKITQDKMHEYLNSFFTKLKKEGFIEKYKIRKSYLP